MKRKVSDEVYAQIEMEKLSKHLNEIEELELQWASELIAWEHPGDIFLERDPITNHMLRKHLRRRELWKHYSEWEYRVERVKTLEGDELSKELAAIQELETRVHDLILKAVKSSDFLYPCQFCRRLWEDG